MNLPETILVLLRTSGPLSRPAIEQQVVGYAPKSVASVLWQLKRSGKVAHTRRASRYRTSLYDAT